MENADVLIRQALLADAALVAKLGARTFFETFAADNTPEDINVYVSEMFTEERIAAEMADPNACFLLAETNHKPIAYAKLVSDNQADGVVGNSPVELVRLYVLHRWIGHGVGAALMLACLDEARQRNHDTMWLGVWEQNARAIQFYEEWGFQIVGSHIFQLGDDSQTDLLMQRPLIELQRMDADFLKVFRQTIDTAVSRLKTVSNKEAAKRPSADAWSAKQILGHLIDSAVNNQRRFVEAQFKDDLVFSGYAQEAWVLVQHYQKAPWSDLVRLWQLINQHLLHVIATIPREDLQRERHPHSLDKIALQPVAPETPISLEYLIRDYFDHLQLHLNQIWETTGIT